MRMIFVNLPIKSAAASKAFFEALGFSFNPKFSSEDTLCMVISDSIFAMLLEEARFKSFINGEIADPDTTESLTCLSCESRQEVDDLLARAKAAGATDWKPVSDMGFMYHGSFRDLDGHAWELMWMDPAAAAG